MYFQENNFEHQVDQREKLTSGTPSRKQKLKRLIFFAIIIVISLIIGVWWSLLLYNFDGQDRGLMGALLTFICLFAFDCLMGWILFAPQKETSIYKFHLRLIVAAASAVIAIPFLYSMWAALSSVGNILFVIATFLCINLILEGCN